MKTDAIADVPDQPGAEENDMRTMDRIRWTAIAVAFCLGLSAMPAQAAQPRMSIALWGEKAISAARDWLGELLREATLAPRGGRTEIPGDESTSMLKQHVDNPAQTPMDDGGH